MHKELIIALVALIFITQVCALDDVNANEFKPKDKDTQEENLHKNHRIKLRKTPQKQPTIKHKKSLNDYVNQKAKIVNIADNWDRHPHILQTYNEPTSYHLMPALSNGFIGTTVKNNSIYVNGLYSGLHERSHRLRVPSMTAVEAYFSLETANEITSFHFDVRRGVYTIESKNTDAILTQKFYVHRRLRNIIVNEVKIELLSKMPINVQLFNLTMLQMDKFQMSSPLNVNNYLYFKQDMDPENITFEHRVIKHPTLLNKKLELNDGIYYLGATIQHTEVPDKREKQVHTYYTNVPNHINVYPNMSTNFKTFHFIQAVDSDNIRARNAYEEAVRAIANDPNGLYVTHVAAWEEIWAKAGIATVAETSYSESNQEALKLAQRLYTSFYNVYSSIPMGVDNQFYGVSPAGLAYGGLRREFFNISAIQPSYRAITEGYGGHIMYNQELWILPLMSMFNVDMSKNIINSRLRRGLNTDSLNIYEQARENARKENLDGLRYAWEQADYGIDVSPYLDARQSKVHTSADISFGIRQYLRHTHSREFLLQSVSADVSVRGEDYLNEIAKYWFDRFELDSQSNQYEINHVSFGERPQSREVDNEAYTNYLAAMSMNTYKYALEVTDKNPYDSQYATTIREYDARQSMLKLPYDSGRNLILEYENFNTAQQNEETFVPYLNYPIQKHLSYVQKKAIYDNYATQLPNEGKNTPTYASYIVGYSELNEEQKARDYLKRFSDQFNGPFLVLSEYPQTTSLINPSNTFNYVPGYAAFAQAFIAAYCGIRVRDFQMDIVYPSEYFTEYQGGASTNTQHRVFKQPAANTEHWNITGLIYKGNKLDIVYSLRSKSVTVTNRRSNDGSLVADDTLEIAIFEGTEMVTKQLRIGDSVVISLTTESWNYVAKKNRLQNSNSYSNNMHILASIYSTTQSGRVIRPSNAGGVNLASSILILSACLMQFKLFNLF